MSASDKDTPPPAAVSSSPDSSTPQQQGHSRYAIRIGGAKDDHSVCQRYVEKAKKCMSSLSHFLIPSSSCPSPFHFLPYLFLHTWTYIHILLPNSTTSKESSGCDVTVRLRSGFGHNGGLSTVQHGGYRRLHP